MNTNTSPQQPASPYKGLAPYDVTDKDNFFGRDREKQILLGKIFANNVTLLFAGTGVGKSSLLRAAIIPALTEQRALDVVYYADWVSEPLEGLKTTIQQTLIANKKMTGRELKMSDNFPAFLGTCTAYASEPLILMLDQFEELFQYHARSGRLLSFVEQIAQVVNAPDLAVRLVFAMREDFLAELNVFKGRMPSLFDNHYRLEELHIEQAREAIEKPVANVGFRYQEGLVEQLLYDLAAREQEHQPGTSRIVTSDQETERVVEPPYLQIVCNELWRAEKDNPQKVITTARYNALGRTTQIVRKHFEQAMQHFSLREQSLAFEMFRYLVTERGTKMAYRAEDLASDQLLGVPVNELEPILAYLASKEVRVLRADQRLDQIWYELYHDVFAQIIRTWTEAFQKDASRYIYTQIAMAARKWKQESEDAFFLLRGDRLFRAKEWSEAHPDAISEEEHAFIQSSFEYERSDVHRQITAATKIWTVEKYDSAFLMPASKLDDAKAWAKSHREILSPEEQAFLKRSLIKYYRGVWLRRGVVAVILMFAVISAIAGLDANKQRQVVEEQRQDAEALRQTADEQREEAVHQAQVMRVQLLIATAKSRSTSTNERALSALQAYLLNKTYETGLDNQITEALRAALAALGGESEGDAEKLVEEVCKKATRKLTSQEWQEAVGGDSLPVPCSDLLDGPDVPEVLHLRSKPMTTTDRQGLSPTNLDPLGYSVTNIANNFEDQGKVILDRATGLMWQKSASSVKPWNANGGCEVGWRLSTVEELLSLMELQRQPENNLYLNPIFGILNRNRDYFWYWSSDRKDSESAWRVNFDSAYVDAAPMSWHGHVRCVRPIQ